MSWCEVTAFHRTRPPLPRWSSALRCCKDPVHVTVQPTTRLITVAISFIYYLLSLIKRINDWIPVLPPRWSASQYTSQFTINTQILLFYAHSNCSGSITHWFSVVRLWQLSLTQINKWDMHTASVGLQEHQGKNLQIKITVDFLALNTSKWEWWIDLFSKWPAGCLTVTPKSQRILSLWVKMLLQQVRPETPRGTQLSDLLTDQISQPQLINLTTMSTLL